MRIKISDIGEFTVICSILLCGILSEELILILNILVLLIYGFKKNLHVEKNVFIIIMLLLFHGIANVMLGNDSTIGLFKQVLGITISLFTYLTVIDENNFIQLFHKYLKISLILSALVIIQHCAYIIGIKSLFDFSWLSSRLHVTYSANLLRASSLMVEPAAFCEILAPAMFVSVYTIIKKSDIYYSRNQALLFLFGYILTFSSVGYIGLIFAIVLLMFLEKRITLKKVLIPLLAICAFIVLYIYVNEFRERLVDTISILSGESSLGKNVSSSTFTVHLQASINALRESHGLGYGIGSYEMIFPRINKKMLFINGNIFNVKDANSLLFRMTAELGVLGYFILFFFFKNNYVGRESDDKEIMIISNSILVFIILRLLRSGHYFNDGFFVFVVMLMRCKESKDAKKDKN